MILEIGDIKRAMFPGGKKQYLILDQKNAVKAKGVGSKNRLTGFCQHLLDDFWRSLF